MAAKRNLVNRPRVTRFVPIRHRGSVIDSMKRRQDMIPALGILVVAVIVLFGLEHVAVGTRSGQARDDSAMHVVSAGAEALQQLHSYLGIISIGTTALALAGCVVLAVIRGRFAVAIGAVVLVAGSDITTQILKTQIFDRPDFGFGAIRSYPSGHTTVAMSSVLAAVLVAPPLFRPLVIVAGSFAATLVGTSTIVGGWHRPSDVIGAILVSLAWATVVAVALGSVHHPQTDGLVTSTFLALVGAGTAGIFLIAVGVRPANGITGLIDAGLILGGVGIATALAIGVYARLVPR